MRKTKILLIAIIILSSFLRLYKLSSNPPSLYWDEASLGYNAYSILKTGYDEHGELLPATRFIAFGDYKPPGYIYTAVPSVALFGLKEFAVRFPSAVFGILSVIITYFLAKELFEKNTAFLSSFLLAISPWHLQLSRGAFEANLGMFFNLFAVYLFIVAAKEKQQLLPISILFFVFSFYTFNANRIIAPFIVLSLSLIYYKSIVNIKKWVVISVILGTILMIPYFSYFQTRESTLRFQEVSIFTNLLPLETSNARIDRDNNSFIARVVHNRRIAYAREFFIHYLDHFKGEFLFIKGDRNPRLSIQETGELYLANLPLFLIGAYVLLKERKKLSAILFSWALIVPIPAGLAKETPHALRIVSILPVPQIIIAIGAWYIWTRVKKQYRKILISLLLAVLLLNISYYLHNYYMHYPTIWSGEWQYGYKQMVNKVTQLQDSYDHIIVTNSLGRPYIYFLFYQQIEPQRYWEYRDADRNWAGLWTVYGFDKYRFNVEDAKDFDGRILIIGRSGEIPNTAHILDEVKQLNGETVFKIGEI